MISFFFPRNNKEANLYGGFMSGETFVRTFKFNHKVKGDKKREQNENEKVSKEINSFLKLNGFSEITLRLDTLDGSGKIFSKNNITVEYSAVSKSYVLYIEKPINVELKEVVDKLIQFRDERDWKQFHNSKDLSTAISIEASELLELFLWKNNEDVKLERLKEELADVLSFSILLANKHNLDISEIILEKIYKNNQKYPISKSKGTSKKYNEL